MVFTVTNDLTHDRRMQRICSTLANAGHSVMLVGRQLPNSKPIEEQPYRQHRLTCAFHSGKLFYVEYNLRLLFYLLGIKCYDIYTAIDLDTIAPVFIAARLNGARKYYDAHEYFSEVPEVVDRPFTKKIWEVVAAFFIPKSSKAYTVGPALAGMFQERYGVEFATIRNVPFAEEEHEGKREYLLYQGALNEGRGLEQLLEAMQRIDRPLKIAGEGDLSEKLRQMAKELGVEHKVSFLGWVHPKDLPALTKDAWLGLNLLENKGLSYYYSLANKFFDYIQHGIPSLNMAFPEYEAVNKNYPVALLIKELSADAISNTINELHQQEARYDLMVQACRKAAATYNWEVEQQTLLDLYKLDR